MNKQATAWILGVFAALMIGLGVGMASSDIKYEHQIQAINSSVGTYVTNHQWIDATYEPAVISFSTQVKHCAK